MNDTPFLCFRQVENWLVCALEFWCAIIDDHGGPQSGGCQEGNIQRVWMSGFGF